MSFFANIQLMHTYRITGRNNYALIVEDILGKGWALFALISIFLYILASSTSYFLFGGIFF